ncbi:hypothetical protein RhiirA1_413638 [Rhizophagus irregularis]|nr:hypothetical protein GLOIN_2v1637630 [Rhizophagus irregularis DAOM 181602=DAOM 197198]PKC71051.1 hypothetical protein RhiirA1_413638 [Rhizophagus irregularis]PKY14661.1 hypothetical protein RhiirB3_400630 [Rhizophagus irregularis]POG68422.1 hypothetical protein GLOIN_2v1637630 [Rhizophagus irregularis DAOM 181602=DAOM 197198]|eukprot:XP_025175288.1 hypothetical protein GLOIN_2v1637630 [Rhizophagus irregularis DAOM 181602=DAOM 197198]
MAIQLFHVVLSIHNEGIAHHDLRFNIMMLIQKNIKLANLGLHLNKYALVYYYGKYLVDIPRFILNQEMHLLGEL